MEELKCANLITDGGVSDTLNVCMFLIEKASGRRGQDHEHTWYAALGGKKTGNENGCL